MALANTRTASPRNRVTRKTVEVSRRVPTPKRDSEPGVGRLLLAAEVSGQEPDRHADPSDQVPEGELEKGEIATRADAGHRDDGERGGFGGDDGEEDGPGRQIASAEEVIGSASLAASNPEAQAQGESEVAR